MENNWVVWKVGQKDVKKVVVSAVRKGMKMVVKKVVVMVGEKDTMKVVMKADVKVVLMEKKKAERMADNWVV